MPASAAATAVTPPSTRPASAAVVVRTKARSRSSECAAEPHNLRLAVLNLIDGRYRFTGRLTTWTMMSGNIGMPSGCRYDGGALSDGSELIARVHVHAVEVDPVVVFARVAAKCARDVVRIRDRAAAEAVSVGDVRLPDAAVVARAERDHLRGSGRRTERRWVGRVPNLRVVHVADAQWHAIEMCGL